MKIQWRGESCGSCQTALFISAQPQVHAAPIDRNPGSHMVLEDAKKSTRGVRII